MIPFKSSVNVKIVGAEGHSTESLLDAIDRGGRFVIYSYNFSLVVMSFKRPSNIYFIRPGENRLVKGLPFTLISLLFGWWGIPWGVIYTIQSLHQNLTGGRDVTKEILARFSPAPAAPAVAGAGAAPAAGKPAKPVSLRRILAYVGVIAAVGVGALLATSFYFGQNLDVALWSGLAKPYRVELNGTAYDLQPGRPILLQLPEGEFVLRHAPAGPDEQRFKVTTDFLSRPFARQSLVINPDQSAIICEESVYYHPTGASVSGGEEGSFSLHASQAFYVVPRPDHWFEPFPATISMDSTSSRERRTRVAPLDPVPLDARVSLLAKHGGYEVVRGYLAAVARFEAEDDTLERAIMTELKPADARQLLESNLGRRPVLVEWHRAYQYFMESHFPGVDLPATYHRWMDAAPEDGDLVYLYARLLVDETVADPLYERARHCRHPSLYGAYALATDKFADGRYAECLDLLAEAERGGMNTSSLHLRKRDTLLALGRGGEALEDVRRRRQADPVGTELFLEELALAQAAHPDDAGGRKAIAGFVAGLRARFGGSDFSGLEKYLTAHLAYLVGDEKQAAELTAKLEGPYNAFEAAIDRRDAARAAAAIKGLGEPPVEFCWILSLAAHAAGDEPAAKTYYDQAVAILAKSDAHSRAVAAWLRTGGPAEHDRIRRIPAYADESRVMFAVLGLRYPEERERYFARVRDLDRNPTFPHLLVQSVCPAAATAPR